MNGNLTKAKELLIEGNYTSVVISEEKIYKAKARGVAPLINWLDEGVDFIGAVAADKVVGKGAALLYAKLGVKEVYALVLSKMAQGIFEKYGIDYKYDILAEAIRNRDNTGLCPIETVVRECDDMDEALPLIRGKLMEMKMNGVSKKIDKVANDAIDQGYVAGASVWIWHKGKELYKNNYGYLNMEEKVAIDDNTIFHMYSMTKPVTAVAVMKLVENGIVNLSDKVGKYIPAYLNQKVVGEDGELVPAKRDITIMDCLTMTSGVTYPDGGHLPGQIMDGVIQNIIGNMYGGNIFSTVECVEKMAQVPLLFQPGEGWLYGLSADILGAVVEVASGKRFGDFLKDEIFEPLGMVDTGFFVPDSKKDRFALVYDPYRKPGKLVRYEGSFLGENYDDNVGFESGGAGLVSTISDYSKFALMLLNKGVYGDVRILKEESIEFMITNHLNDLQKGWYTDAFLKGYGYGCLVRIQEDEKLAADSGTQGEFGWDGWTGNYFTVNPKEDLIIMYFIQRAGEGFGILPRKIRDIIKEDIL